MNHLNYVEIRMYEGERRGWFGPLNYQRFVEDLWNRGVSGLTVTRAESGFDHRGKVQDIHSDYVSDNLPIVIECVVSDAQLKTVLDAKNASSGTLEAWVTERVADAKSMDAKSMDAKSMDAKSMEGEVASMAQCGVLKVYMKESDEVNGEALHQALLGRLGELGVTWVSVSTALEGYGKDQVLRRNHNFSLANHAPVVLEAVLTSKVSVDEVLRRLTPLLERSSGPAIFIEGRTL